MRGIRNLELAIQAIQAGNPTEGARLIRIALRDDTMTGPLKATAYMWMAETTTDLNDKARYYNDALSVDPGNEHAKQRLSQLLTTSLPPVQTSQPQVPLPPAAQPVLPPQQPILQPVQPSTQPMQPVHTPQPMVSTGTQPLPAVSDALPAQPAAPTRASAMFYRTVGITDGPNGPGTGFFITKDGLIATTRYVISGRENVTIELEPGRFIMGKVVRSFTELDLAIVQVEMDLARVLPFAKMAFLPENLDLTAYAHNNNLPVRGRVRTTTRETKAGWFPTNIRQIPDAGGNPVFDDRNQVVGMLTRNASRTSPDLFGLLIDRILNLAEQYRVEVRMDPNREYCPNCGHLSRAAVVGGFYCEACGSTLPHALALKRTPIPHADAIYGENMHRPCRNCGARVGYYNGYCLRCGAMM